ncbi:MAG: FAD-binding protein [Saprospiraceae bacterium]|nr:FAD-binding protein [Saprospiraceae bacterium]
MKQQNESNRAQAIVMGASLGGLMTAKVLSQHFQNVLIIEKDTVNHQPESRKGQPQTRHLHGLLPAGFNVILRYFPDISQALSDAGANLCDFAETMIWQTYGGYRKRFNMNLTGVTMSRPLLEHLVRERVLALPNVQLMDNTSVKQLQTNTDKSRITGILVEQKGDTQPFALDADLVVDVTGRISRTPQWLTELGYEAPPVSEVNVNVGYATRVYKRKENDPRSNNWMLFTPKAPDERRFGGIFPIEDNRWIATIGGWHGDSAAMDENGFNQFAKSLGMPEIADIICNSEPLSEIMPYKFTCSLRRHYEKLNRFPLGYLVLGDAVSSFNPTYGQGMSSASLQAAELDSILSSQVSEEKLALTFFKKAAKVVDIPWQLSVGEDFRYPETTGPKPAGVDFINKYVSKVHKATLKDPIVCEAFLRVMSLLKPPTSLFHPRILWRVLTA